MSSAKTKPAAARAVRALSAAKLGGNLGAVMLRSFLGLAFVAALAPCAAYAGTDTDSFEVTATVLASCEVSASDLAFGNYDPVSAAHLDADTSLSVTCTNGTPYYVALSLGDGAGATMAQRRMTKSGDTATLNYVLYQDDQRSVLWGDTGADRLSGTGDGTPDTIDVYGRVPMQQSAPAGAYTDTIIVTVSW
ncbi:MAG: spore coat U domain-containing protein [Terricaulis sp.]